MNNQTPPIILVYVYSKIREKVKGNIIKNKELKDIIGKLILSNKGVGGNRKGIPRIYYNDIIRDLINFSFLERLDNNKYQLNEKYEIENPILQINQILNKLKIPDGSKLVYINNINNILEKFLDKISINEKYQINKINYKSQLKEFPY